MENKTSLLLNKEWMDRTCWSKCKVLEKPWGKQLLKYDFLPFFFFMNVKLKSNYMFLHFFFHLIEQLPRQLKNRLLIAFNELQIHIFHLLQVAVSF